MKRVERPSCCRRYAIEVPRTKPKGYGKGQTEEGGRPFDPGAILLIEPVRLSDERGPNEGDRTKGGGSWSALAVKGNEVLGGVPSEALFPPDAIEIHPVLQATPARRVLLVGKPEALVALLGWLLGSRPRATLGAWCAPKTWLASSGPNGIA